MATLDELPTFAEPDIFHVVVGIASRHGGYALGVVLLYARTH